MRQFKKLYIHAVGVASLCVLGIAAYVFGIDPMFAVHQQVQSEQQQAIRYQQLLPKLERECQELQAELALLPPDTVTEFRRDSQAILASISASLQLHNLTLKNFAETKLSDTSADIDIEVLGEYRALLTFIDQLSEPGELAKFQRLELRSLDRNGEECRAKLQVRFTLDLGASLLAKK